MKWIIDDIKEAWRELQRWETWLVILLLVGFGVLTFLIVRFAFRTDALLSYLGVSGGYCKLMSNKSIISMFSGMVFFALTAVLTLGETQQYFQAKKRGAHQQAKKSLRWAFFWGATAIALASGALIYFSMNCY
ncbi:hypothetical protein [Azonexus sp.]|uniref:hypothetical protein n=1 Tax=Azonexus sp. TaxID=1872668 RepID=UPI0027BA24DF|nr:hypothetical protein [Azonexus sp.]